MLSTSLYLGILSTAAFMSLPARDMSGVSALGESLLLMYDMVRKGLNLLISNQTNCF